jgi:hypothetical protein
LIKNLGLNFEPFELNCKISILEKIPRSWFDFLWIKFKYLYFQIPISDTIKFLISERISKSSLLNFCFFIFKYFLQFKTLSWIQITWSKNLLFWIQIYHSLKPKKSWVVVLGLELHSLAWVGLGRISPQLTFVVISWIFVSCLEF